MPHKIDPLTCDVRDCPRRNPMRKQFNWWKLAAALLASGSAVYAISVWAANQIVSATPAIKILQATADEHGRTLASVVAAQATAATSQERMETWTKQISQDVKSINLNVSALTQEVKDIKENQKQQNAKTADR